MTRVGKLVAGSGLVVAVVAGATGMEVVRAGHAGAAAVLQEAIVAAPDVVQDTSPSTLSAAFRNASRRALPGVVNIQVESARQGGSAQMPDPFRGTPFEDLFRGQPPQGPRTGNGSGFIFRPDGYIITNNHVIEGAERVAVVLQDRREFDARVVGRDPNTDVAVLKIEAVGLPTVRLGDSDRVDVGDWVVALGYPLQLGSTASVTAGIVSAKGRNINILRRNSEASAPLEHFIQTDAAINPGNSGGPLVDLDGRVVGMNTAIASPTGYYSGYGFAVPMNLARRIADDLIQFGEVRRPRLGAGISDVDPADAEVYRLDRVAGVEVNSVQSGSPAQQAGMQIGDVILGIEGHPVVTSGDLMEQLARRQPGDRVRLDVVRYGEALALSVELGAFEPAVRAQRLASAEPVRGAALLGMRVENMTPQAARRVGTAAVDGVVVAEVAPYGAAARAGLQPGLLVERFNGQPVASVADFERAAQSVRPGQAVSLVVRPEGGEPTIVNFRLRE